MLLFLGTILRKEYLSQIREIKISPLSLDEQDKYKQTFARLVNNTLTLVNDSFTSPQDPWKLRIELFYRNRLRQIPWLIHITSSHHCNVIRKKL